MKRKLLMGLVSCSLVAGATSWADDNKVDVEVNTRDGKNTVGEKLDKAGDSVRGSLGKVTQGAKNMVADLKLQDLPQAVQKTIQEQSGGATIADIDREDRTGKTIYEIEFAKEGKDHEIHVSEDGMLIPKQQASLTGGPKNDKDNNRSLVRDRLDDTDNNNPKFADLPASVQATARQHGAENQIADVDRSVRNGKVIYEIEFKRDGLNKEIHVDESGMLLNDEAVGNPGSGSKVEGSEHLNPRPTLNPAPAAPAIEVK